MHDLQGYAKGYKQAYKVHISESLAFGFHI
jgi:hypothetical protein